MGDLRRLLSVDSQKIVGDRIQDNKNNELVKLTTESLLAVSQAHSQGLITSDEKKLLKEQILNKKSFDKQILGKMTEIQRRPLDNLNKRERLTPITSPVSSPIRISSQSLDLQYITSPVRGNSSFISPEMNDAAQVVNDNELTKQLSIDSNHVLDTFGGQYELRKQLSIDSSTIVGGMDPTSDIASLTKALYFIRLSHEEGRITFDEKGILKRRILSKTPLVRDILEKMSFEHRSYLNIINYGESTFPSKRVMKINQNVFKLKTLFGEVTLKVPHASGTSVYLDENVVTASHLKESLCSKTNFNAGDIMLIRNGRTIPDFSIVTNDKNLSMTKSPKEDIFLVVKPSCTTPCVFNLKLSDNTLTKTFEDLKFPANTKIFALKREFYKITKIHEGSMRLIIASKVMKDEYMLGDYIILAAKRSLVSLSGASTCTIFMSRTIDLRRSVKCSTRLPLYPLCSANYILSPNTFLCISP